MPFRSKMDRCGRKFAGVGVQQSGDLPGYKVTIAACAALLSMSAAANAAVISRADLSGAETLGDPKATMVQNNPVITANGFTLTDSAGPNWRTDISTAGYTNLLTDNAPTSYLTLSFDEAQAVIAFDLVSSRASYDISYFTADGSLIETVSLTMPTLFSGVFVGFESALGISKVVIDETRWNNTSPTVTGIANIAFLELEADAVPVPAAAVLFASGLLGAGAARRKAKR
ncbi:hypothetical protein [Parvularcula sp. LCG005]|uniref:hypothetical protein n=1 Tax=Parvularcula sp. LCG005 TaxID=3078805 RepID=UPI002942CDE5|nr:hypothetical protein [Parvularcula sp. LCG005]WOI52137.1 hypothetical protein RUI03_08205 [Parvularcula sp. LCG005]